MSEIKPKRLEGFLDLPELRLRGPNTFEAAKRDGQERPSIVRRFAEMHPIQNAWPPYHPALVRHASLEEPTTRASELLHTDVIFVRHTLQESRAADEHRRIEHRRLVERDEAKRHARASVRNETDRQLNFHARARDIAHERTSLHVKAKRLQLAYFEFVRELALETAITETDRSRELGFAAVETRRLLREWRMSDLWVATATGGTRRTPGRGQEPEAATGELLRRDRKELVERNQQWRKDGFFITMANGGMQRSLNGSGSIRETVEAKVFQPKLDRRDEAHDHWHRTNFFISTPNGSMMRAEMQGFVPEKANAERFEPLLADRGRLNWEWRRDGLYQRTANDGIARLSGYGMASEAVTAELYEPLRDARTEAHRDWHSSGLSGPTPNDGYAPLPGHGKSVVAVTADAAQPLKDERMAGHDLWHDRALQGPTPNGGYASLAGRGRSIVDVTGDHAQVGKDRATKGHDRAYSDDRYGMTPNHVFARLKTVGQPYEVIGAEFTERLKAEASVRHDVRAEDYRDALALGDRVQGFASQAPTGTASNPRGVDTLHVGTNATGVTPRPDPETSMGTPGMKSGSKAGSTTRPDDGERTARGASTPRKAWQEMQRSLAAHEKQLSSLHTSNAQLSALDEEKDKDKDETVARSSAPLSVQLETETSHAPEPTGAVSHGSKGSSR